MAGVNVHDEETVMFIKENLNQIIELQNFHNKRLLIAEEEVSQLKNQIKNYETLRAKVTTLPDKTKHDVMVPFGSLAFMPGQIIHTNEILTHLGDNWFAELSAKEAAAIINRRIQVCKDKLKQAESVSHIHRGWVEQSGNIIQNEADDIKITETISEAEYIREQELHRLNLRKSRKTKKTTETLTDEELLQRLDQLMMQETERNELNEMSEETLDSDDSEMEEEPERHTMQTDQENILHFKRERLQRRVSWADHITDSEMEEDYYVELPESDQTPVTSKEAAPIELMQDEAASLPIEPTPVQRSNSLSKGERPKGILKKSMSTPVPPLEAEAMKVTFVQNLPEDEDEPPAAKSAPLSESPKEIRSLKNPAMTYKIVVNE